MLKRIKNFFSSIFSQDQSPERLSASFCVGNYIAFSPYFGLHGVMVVICSWLFGLNFGIMFAAAYGINNLWTAIPIYTADYFFWPLAGALRASSTNPKYNSGLA